jgi:hypothetical protein
VKSKLLEWDTRDDRKEVHQLLTRLSPRDRLRWLAWCCENAVLPNSDKHPAVDPTSKGQALEVFMDWWTMVSNYTVDAGACLRHLVGMVKRRGRRLGSR